MTNKVPTNQWSINEDENDKSDDNLFDEDDRDPVDLYRKGTQTTTNSFENEFVRLCNDVSNGIYAFSQKVSSIQRQTQFIGDNSKEADFRKTREQGRALARRIGGDIKDLARYEATAPTSDASRRIKQQKLKKDFTDVLKGFEQVEREAGEKEREIVERTKQKNVLIDIGSGDEQNNIEAGSVQLSSRGGRRGFRGQQQQGQRQMQVQTTIDLQTSQEIAYNEQIIASREQGITEIEQTIEEVNNLFQDLGSLVYEQGHMLDNIESNIVSASQQVEDAHEQVLTAEDYQKSSHRRMCYVLYFFLIILLIVILILAITLL
eukprot:CFRG3147T1